MKRQAKALDQRRSDPPASVFYGCGTESLLPGGIENRPARAKPFGIEILLPGGDGRCFIRSPRLHDGLDLPFLEVGVDQRGDRALILFAEALDGLELKTQIAGRPALVLVEK